MVASCSDPTSGKSWFLAFLALPPVVSVGSWSVRPAGTFGFLQGEPAVYATGLMPRGSGVRIPPLLFWRFRPLPPRPGVSEGVALGRGNFVCRRLVAGLMGAAIGGGGRFPCAVMRRRSFIAGLLSVPLVLRGFGESRVPDAGPGGVYEVRVDWRRDAVPLDGYIVGVDAGGSGDFECAAACRIKSAADGGRSLVLERMLVKGRQVGPSDVRWVSSFHPWS